MRKIGILGGTFNPIHNGHLALAEASAKQYGLDEVLFMPSKLPPHKSHFSMLSEEHRLALVKLAVQKNPKFTASDFELRREGLTYTADTLELLTKEHPDCRYYFIIGGDSLLYFHEWRRPERILELCTLLAAGRSGIGRTEEEECVERLRRLFPDACVERVKLPEYPISSSEIRKAFYTGQADTVKDFLPEGVFSYLQEKKLFSKISFGDLDAEMQKILPRKRYLHSVAVAHLSAAYASVMGLDTELALTAGILHDCAKAYSDEALLEKCEKFQIPVTDFERRNGYLLHGKVGAYFAKEEYFITDERILSAITYHTTGRAAMTPYEKIVFLADYLEPFRTHKTTPPLEKLRALAFQDIDAAVLMALENTIHYLKQNEKEFDPTSTEAYAYYKNEVNNRKIEE